MRKRLIRLLLAIPQALGILAVMFVITHVLPGDPVVALVGDFPAPPEYVARLREQLGLDQPLPAQFVRYMSTILRGDLGYSFSYGAPVSEVIASRVGATVLLTATALLFGSSLGVLLGVIAARQRRSMISGLVSIGGVAGYAVPSFWLAQLAILLFGVELGWLPLSGMVSIRTPREGFDHVIDVANHLILPALVLSVGHVALTSRFTRSNVLDVLEQDYVRTAHAKGLPERSVVIDHVLRNALLPVVSVIGYNLGFLLSGSALVETVFGWPGLGRLLYDSLFRRDNAVLLGVFLTTNLAAILGNLIADLVSTWLDPRLARQV